MNSLVSVTLFLILVGLAVAGSIMKSRRQLFRNLLIGFVVGANLFVAVTQFELWPFSSWPLIALDHPESASHVRLAVIDIHNREHPIDARAVHPIEFLELMGWLDGPFGRLSKDDKDQALLWLIQQVEQNRRKISDGDLSTPGRPLGPLTAPRFLLTPKHWNDELPGRIIGLRLYRDTWNLEERARDPRASTSELLHETRLP